jgi:tetratricopeptide (TPR) repeat protein
MTTMGKHFVPYEARTPAGLIRDTLSDVERMLPNLRGAGSDVLKLLHLLDQAEGALAELDAAGADVRAERARFGTVQARLRRYQRRFLVEAGVALQEERVAVQPDRARWWWFLDEIVAQERKQQLRRGLKWAVVAILFLAAAWLAYDRLLAPPPKVREAREHSAVGERLVQEGDLQAALAEFEAAVALCPDDPQGWLWLGVIHSELDEPDEAESAFATARSLYETGYDFLLDRGQLYLRARNLEAASADTEQAILENPDSARGYYARSFVFESQRDYAAAVADLERAAELAHEAGDAQLEAAARVQLAMVMQLWASDISTPTP